MNWEIGEIKQIKGEWYQCVEGNDCANCVFIDYCKSHTKEERDDTIGLCVSFDRNDGMHVIFKKLEKVGGTFACRNMSLGCYGIIVQRYKVFAEPILTDNSIKWCDSTNETILIALINKQDMEEKNNGNTPLNVLTDKYVNGDICYDDFEKEVKALYSCKEEIKPTLKEFDLEAAKLGKPVCTRDGHKARIICFDYNGETGDYPIVALVHYNKGSKCYERVLKYTSDGLFNKYGDCQHNDDLMMLPEKKEGWINIIKTEDGGYCCKGEVNSDYNDAFIENINVLDNRGITVRIEWEE